MQMPGMIVMGKALALLALSIALTLPTSPLATAAVHSHSHSNSRNHQPELPPEEEAEKLAAQIDAEVAAYDAPVVKKTVPMSMAAKKTVVKKQAPEPEFEVEEGVKVDAANAKEAASVAKNAAKVANKVAAHAAHITGHAKEALHHALGALHDARVDTKGLSSSQKESLKKAEGRLREATKTADYGKLKKLEEKNAVDVKKDRMQEQMDQRAMAAESERDQMLKDIEQLRGELREKGGDAESDKALMELEEQIKTAKPEEFDELKAEIERLREQIGKMEKPQPVVQSVKTEEQDEEEKEELMKDVQIQPLKPASTASVREVGSTDEVTPVQDKGIDIDTAMPYGDLEPFGREDTAQELTENSVKESDEMVDQLERAEVAEEKRAVFRALTRLRGAAITSFDGVARSQTGNIDEYNKVHKWRNTHPLHHLADEESDVSKWAFPDNAD